MLEEKRKRSRTRSPSPPPWRRQTKSPRHDFDQDRRRSNSNHNYGLGRGRGNFQNHHQKRNQEREDRQMREWMSQEDDFVLKQSKKKARIRIKEGRAKAIDRLVLLLSIVDPSNDLLEDELDNVDLEIIDPVILLEGLTTKEVQDLDKDIQHYLVLEHNETNLTFWKSLKSICKCRIQVQSTHGSGRGIGSVTADIESLLAPKSLEQLQTLETQVHQKLRSDQVIDEEYWEQLLDSIVLFKAKAQLKHFYAKVNDTRLRNFELNQIAAARQLQGETVEPQMSGQTIGRAQTDDYDPAPRIRLQGNEQGLEILDEDAFLDRIAHARIKVSQAGYISGNVPRAKPQTKQDSRLLNFPGEDNGTIADAMYNNEAAIGFEEDEEVFGNDDEVNVVLESVDTSKHQFKKPKHFNRVQMGYEWNKYNQTHYDHDNPPPKVVQGYRFNIFYPDLVDTSRAPTYRIDRENGRKKGQSLAPAGEEDTCIIRFIAGPPYEDIAFRIVDREWDYSARRDRGFKSSFEKGVLQLHFQFKKIHYRK